MIAGISYLDAALVAVVAISGMVAMYRGLTREVLSIISWIAAAGAAFYVIFSQAWLADELAKQFAATPTSMHQIIAKISIGTVVFLVVLVVVHLITSHISDSVLDSRVGAIDRILGLFFGAVRGFILIVIPYMFAVSFVCKDGATRIGRGCEQNELPKWVENARSVGLIRQTGGALFGVFDRLVPRTGPLGGGSDKT